MAVQVFDDIWDYIDNYRSIYRTMLLQHRDRKMGVFQCSWVTQWEDGGSICKISKDVYKWCKIASDLCLCILLHVLKCLHACVSKTIIVMKHNYPM